MAMKTFSDDSFHRNTCINYEQRKWREWKSCQCITVTGRILAASLYELQGHGETQYTPTGQHFFPTTVEYSKLTWKVQELNIQGAMLLCSTISFKIPP